MIKKRFTSLLYFYFFWAFSISIQAQDTEPTPIDFELQTFQYYQAKTWKKLITTGKQAIKKGIDYYYLRLRIGIAYYEQKNYKQAEEHFIKALQFNSTDPLSQEYLFYCYLFSGKTEEARKLSLTFSNALKSKLKYDKTSDFDFVHVETATKIPKKIVFPESNLNYFDNAYYFQVGLKHSVRNFFSFYHAGSYYNQDTYFGAINQKQYFVQASIPTKNNWLITPSFHYVGLSVTGQEAFLGSTALASIVSNKTYNIGSLQVRKSMGKFDYALGSTFSNISDVNQNNHFGSVSYAAFGNTKLVFGFTEYLHTSNQYQSLNNAFSPFIYFEPLKFFGISLGYFTNQNNNIIETNGSLANNSPDLTTARYSVLVNFRVNQLWSLYTICQYENKIETTSNLKYNYTLLLTGIKINTGL